MTPLLLMLAYRGKGGWFEQWGIKSAFWRRILSSLIAAIAVGGLGVYSLILIPLWFLFIAPDIGTGFACISDDGRFAEEIHQPRKKLDILCSLADKAAQWALNHGLSTTQAAIIWMTIRQCYVIPFLILGGATWGLLGCFALGGIYWLGGLYERKTLGDPVEMAEIVTGLWLGSICLI